MKAGAKAADIAAQQGEVTRLDAELANAQSEYRRAESLHKDGLVTNPCWSTAG